MSAIRRILIVDDSRTVRLALAAALRNELGTRLEVVEAHDKEEALESFAERAPDVVFLDMVLPGESEGMVGFDILKSMLAARPEVPIVLVSGLPADHPEIVGAVNLGAFARIEKPLRPDDVRRVLDALEPERSTTGYA